MLIKRVISSLLKFLLKWLKHHIYFKNSVSLFLSRKRTKNISLSLCNGRSLLQNVFFGINVRFRFTFKMFPHILSPVICVIKASFVMLQMMHNNFPIGWHATKQKTFVIALKSPEKMSRSRVPSCNIQLHAYMSN